MVDNFLDGPIHTRHELRGDNDLRCHECPVSEKYIPPM